VVLTIPDDFGGTAAKNRLTPGNNRDTLPNIGGNSSPLFAIRSATNPFDLPNKNRNALCAQKSGVRMLVPIGRNILEGKSQTQ